MKKFFCTLIICFCLLLHAKAKAVVYGQLTGMPADGTVTYIAYLADKNFPPAEILTEDGFNSALGTNQGYQQSYFLLEKGNFTGEPYNANVKLLFNGIGSELEKKGEIINKNGPNENLGIVDFFYNSSPLQPNKPRAIYFAKQKFIFLYWTNTSECKKYLIYRSTLPSGADNNHSNGRYSLIGQTHKNYFLDRDIISGITAWYVILAINNNRLSGHSDESDATHTMNRHSEEAQNHIIK